MDGEAKWVYERMKLHQLMQEHPDWSLRQYARHLQHDLKWVRKWKKRIDKESKITLKTFTSESRAPKKRPQQISEQAKDWVVDLRQDLSVKYHRQAGAKTILYALNALPTEETDLRIPKGLSTIHRILYQRGYIAPVVKRWREPLVLPPPMEEWEMDFGQIRLDWDHIFEFFMVADRGTSRLVYLEGGLGYRAESALEALSRLFLQNGCPKRVRFDRDPRLWGSWTRDSYPSPMVRFLRVLGIEPVVCPPRRPDKKPFIERMIFTFKHEWLARSAPTDLASARDLVHTFPKYYNSQRPHQGQACQNRTPDEAFPHLPTLPTVATVVDPDAWLNSQHQRVYRRRVNAAGTIQIDRHVYTIGTAFAKQQVLVELDAEQRELTISDGQKIIRKHPIQGLFNTHMDFQNYRVAMQTEARYVDWHYQSLWQKQNEGV